MEKVSDIALITRAVMFQDSRSFDRLVEKHQSQVRRFFLNLTQGDRDLSDDLAQETFIKAWTSLSSFRATSSFSTWLLRIGYNNFYDYLRSRKEAMDIDQILDTSLDISCEDPDHLEHQDLYQALGHLSQAERTAITLFYMESMKIKEIEKITGMRENTIKSHLKRGKEKLAAYLKQNGYGEQ